jgi:hypothetical protein
MAILTSDYNALQARILKILGTGENEFGYGQTVSSYQLDTTVPALIPDFTRLRTDILAARYHQIGVPATLPISAVSTQLTAANWAQFLSVMTQVETSKLVSPNITQATRIELLNEETPNNTWNNTTTHTVTVQFDDAEHMRHYFNTGSAIEFSASSTNTATNSKSVAWNSLLAGIGVVSFRYSATTSTKTSGSVIGFKSLAPEDQVIFKKTKADTPAANIYQILARQEVYEETGEPTGVLIFTISYVNTGANVTGILRSIVKVYHASGSYVAIDPPALSSEFTPGASNPTFALSRSVANVSEAGVINTVDFTVTTTNFFDGLLYFSISGTSISASDFNIASDLITGTLRGTVDIVDNSGTFTLIASADLFTEGREQFQIQIRIDDNTKGPVLAQLTSLEIITDTSLTPPAPSYTILPLSTTAVTEGQTVLYRIVTKNVRDGTDLYWNTKVLTQSLLPSDFLDNRINGIVTVYGNYAELYRTIYEDTINETTAESYQIVLSVLNADTGISKTVQTSELVKITDKVSIEPIIPYLVLADDSSIPEDSTTLITFTIKTPNLPINTRLYWKVVKDSGVLTAADFTDNRVTGTVVISKNVGIVTRKAKKDALTEGNETFHLSVFSDVGMTNWLVDSDPITIEETASYNLVRTPATMEESTTLGALGAGVTFNLTTPWMPPGTVLYWTTVSSQGVITAADFTDNATDGFVVITDNSNGTIFRRAAKDTLIEGTEEFYLEIRATAGTLGPVLVSSQRTAITETVGYEIIPLNSYMVENQPGIDFDVKTPFLKNGTVLYWDTVAVTGVITASDFTDNRLSGTVEINGNVGSITRTAILDSLTEGTESFRLILKTGSSISTKVATSSIVTIGESVAYTVSLTSPSFTEGLAPITVSITTPAVLDNTKIFWTILKHAGNITADDFIVSDAQGGLGQRLDGFVSTTKNKGSFIISAKRDLITEEAETFQIELRTDSILGAVQATSAIITLNEIIPYTIVPSATLVNEGDTVIFSVTTPWVADTDKLQLNWTTYSTLGTINTTDHPDFTDSITGSVIVKGNSAQISRTINKDTFTELGVKNFGIKLWTTTGTLLATSTIVTMNDTSQTIVVPDPDPPTYSVVPRKSKIIEGESVIFDIFTDNVLPATPLYWSTIRSNNLLDGELLQTQSTSPVYITYDNPGTSTLGRTTITITASANNNRVQSDRMFLLVLRTGSVNGTEVATSALPVALVDATPYMIRANNSSITEGSPTGVRFDISTPDVAFGTTMTYTIVPVSGSNITFEDFVGLSSLTNSVAIDQYGAGNFTLNAAANSPKELDESFSIELRLQGSSTPVTLGAPSPVVKITETAVYSLTSTTAGNSVMEGSAATFTFSTPKLLQDIPYSYRIVGVGANGSNIDGSDFSPAGLTGNFTVTSAASSYDISLLTTVGSVKGSRDFQLEIKSGGSPVVLNGGSPTITITENTPYTIKPRTSSPSQEGDKITFEITAPKLPLNQTLMCVIKPVITSGPGSFTGSDLDIRSLTPLVVLTDGMTGTLEFTPIDDGTTKGNRPFVVWLYNVAESSYVSSSTVVITDRAATPTPTPPPNIATWKLSADKKIVIQGTAISYTLVTSAPSTSNQTISWTISIIRQEDVNNPNSNPFSQTTGSFTFLANTGKGVFTVPTIASPGIVVAKIALTLNGDILAFTDEGGVFNNTGIYPTVAFSGYAAEVVVAQKKQLSISLSKNQLVKGTTDSFKVTVTAPWYLGSGNSTGKILVSVVNDNFWSAYLGPNNPNPNAHFLPIYQDVIVTGIRPGMTINNLYMDATGECTIKLNDNPKNAVANSPPLNLESHTFYVAAANLHDYQTVDATNQPFTVVAKPSYAITADKPSINETTNKTVRFTVTTPASDTSTTLYWTLIGVEFTAFEGLTSSSGSKSKTGNSTWFEFTAKADNITNVGKREFFIEVRSTSTGPQLDFTFPCPNILIEDTSKSITRTITITSIKNGNNEGSTSITMPRAAGLSPDPKTGKLVIVATVSPSFPNEKFTLSITNCYANIQASISGTGVTNLVPPQMISSTTNSSSQVEFTIMSIYRQNATVISNQGTFQFTIASVSDPTCTKTSDDLRYLLPAARVINYSKTNIDEAVANNGSITDTIDLALDNDTYTGTNGQPLAGAVVSNVPTGLTASVIKTSSTVATVTFTGNATPHTARTVNFQIKLGDISFTGGSAATVTNATNSDLKITFRDPAAPPPVKAITYSATEFKEADANDGSIATSIKLTLNNDTYTGTNGQPLAGAEVSNVPAGLTAVVTKTSPQVATVSFTGYATAHSAINSITNLTITLGYTAFAGGSATTVAFATRPGLKITFNNPAADPKMTIVGSTVVNLVPTVAWNGTATLSISGGSNNASFVLAGGLPTPITGLKLDSNGGYTRTIDAANYTAGSTTTFKATFTGTTLSCSATLNILPKPKPQIIASIKWQPSTITVGDGKLYSAQVEFDPVDRELAITVTIETNNPLIRRSLGANETTGVLTNVTNNGLVFMTTQQPSGVRTVNPTALKAIPVVGLPESSTFQLKYTTTNPYTNLPLFVSTTDITLIVPVVYTNTLNLETSTNPNGLSLKISFSGNPKSIVTISCTKVVTVATNPSVYSGYLDDNGNGTTVYVVENTAYPAPSPFRTMSLGAKGNITATFADGTKITKGFAIKGAMEGIVTPPLGAIVRAVAVGGGGGGGASIEKGSVAGSSGGGGGAGGISIHTYIADGTAVPLSGGAGGVGGVEKITQLDSNTWVSVAPTDGGNSTITYKGISLIGYGGKAGGRGIAIRSGKTLPLVPQGGAGGNGTTSNGGKGGNGMFDNRSGASTNAGAPGGVNTDGVDGFGAGGASPPVSESGDQTSWAKKPGFSGKDGRAMISWIDLSNTAPIVADPPVTAPTVPAYYDTVLYNTSGNMRDWQFAVNVKNTREATMFWQDLHIPVTSWTQINYLADDQGWIKLYNDDGNVQQISSTGTSRWVSINTSLGVITKIEAYYKDTGGSPYGARGMLTTTGLAVEPYAWTTRDLARHYK